MALSRDDRIKKVDELRQFWVDCFTKTELGVSNLSEFYFYPKPLMSDKKFTLFPTELKEGLFFTEIIDFNYNPLTVRRLFKIKFSVDSVSKYQKTDTQLGEQYKVPFSDFTEVVELEEIIDNLVKLDDGHYPTDMTLRDYACIQLKVAKSNKKWLNELISESKK